MANNQNTNSGTGLTWVILLCCVAFIGFIIYSTQVSLFSEGKSLWGNKEDAQNDLFASGGIGNIQITEEYDSDPNREALSGDKETSATTECELSSGVISREDPLLVLVNPNNPASSASPQLVSMDDYDATLTASAANALQIMLKDGESLGLRFVVYTSYRSVERQGVIFEEALNRRLSTGMSQEEAYAATVTAVLPAGHSEHCTGLAVDILSYYHQKLDDAQENTPETRWLQTHCWEYGFILRYPKDKTDITGVTHEPWHYRYVGKEMAKYLTENKLTLEEYHALNS
ncbi:MAG: M15 family metallopeptidase [Oscillospiraceae bacterium]|nr:M15 family metallopeptidase [Oscillospiraceae bacterium]